MSTNKDFIPSSSSIQRKEHLQGIEDSQRCRANTVQFPQHQQFVPTNSSTGRTMNQSRRRISWYIHREDKLIKNRKVVDGHLRRLGHGIQKDLFLNTDGVCYFPYKKFIVVVEVPEDNCGVVFIYTLCCRLCPGDDRNAVLLAAMNLNYMQVGTRGGSLGVDGDEVNLCFSVPIHHLSRDDFLKCLEDFLQTATEMNECLEAAKATVVQT